jgi:hypothetical protein
LGAAISIPQRCSLEDLCLEFMARQPRSFPIKMLQDDFHRIEVRESGLKRSGSLRGSPRRFIFRR